jgi:predicted nucleic acid-binding Zn ribbon protein
VTQVVENVSMTESRFPQRIGSIVNQLLARRGYAQVFAADALQSVVEAEVGQALAVSVRVGKVSGGVLHVYAADSVTLQELTFRKRALLKRIQADLPENKINDIRFRVQTL